MKEIIKKLTQAISPDRVISLPTKVFLCGGPVEEARADGRYTSMRHFIYAYIKHNDPEFFAQIILADKINLWLEDKDSEYSDLLELEEDLAGLASAIPLFVESAGSYAELGSFVLLPHISEKLLFFVENKYRDDRSFIGLGPIKRLINEHGENRVQTYMWPPIGEPFLESQVMGHIAPEIYTTIKALSEESNKSDTRVFNGKIAAHKILLICDIINLLHISRLTEIEETINNIGVLIDGAPLVLNRTQLKKYLLIASKLELIEKLYDGKGEDAYYVSSDSPQSGYIKYSASEGKTSERKTWKILIQAHIEKHEPRRNAVRKKWAEDQAREKSK